MKDDFGKASGVFPVTEREASAQTAELLMEEIFGKRNNIVLLIEHEGMGGENDAARTELAELLRAISEAELLPRAIVLSGAAVRLAFAGNPALGSLCRMEAFGVEIVFGEDLQDAGTEAAAPCCGSRASYDRIWSMLAEADKVITL